MIEEDIADLKRYIAELAKKVGCPYAERRCGWCELCDEEHPHRPGLIRPNECSLCYRHEQHWK